MINTTSTIKKASQVSQDVKIHLIQSKFYLYSAKSLQ